MKTTILVLFLFLDIQCSFTQQTNTNATGAAQHAKKQKPILIQEQGSFAVGGTVISNPGTFDPYNPTLEGQTFRGDHAYI